MCSTHTYSLCVYGAYNYWGLVRLVLRFFCQCQVSVRGVSLLTVSHVWTVISFQVSCDATAPSVAVTTLSQNFQLGTRDSYSQSPPQDDFLQETKLKVANSLRTIAGSSNDCCQVRMYYTNSGTESTLWSIGLRRSWRHTVLSALNTGAFDVK